jgi:hypothetical protein
MDCKGRDREKRPSPECSRSQFDVPIGAKFKKKRSNKKPCERKPY